jgi:CelD/BcsL family acetyltransferase involved in cellulose biosynthesis
MIALDPSDARWHQFVEGCPSALPFHHPAWMALIAECYRYRAFGLAYVDSREQILAGLPVVEVGGRLRHRRWVSLPFTDECPVLTRADVSEADLLEDLDRARRRAGVSSLEIRASLGGGGARTNPVAVTHRLSLDHDPNLVYGRRIRASVRKWITRAERAGVVIRRGDTSAALTRTFYGLHVRTRRRLGVPVQPRRYFELLWERIVEPQLGFVLLAYAGKTAIAGAVFLTWNRTVTYKYGASDATSWRLHPNHLLFWTAIRWSCENGIRTFDFGRSDLGSSGLRQFKASWGAREASLAYTTVGTPPAAIRSSSGRLHDLVGVMIRHSPPLACRAVGGLLYRYAA